MSPEAIDGRGKGDEFQAVGEVGAPRVSACSLVDGDGAGKIGATTTLAHAPCWSGFAHRIASARWSALVGPKGKAVASAGYPARARAAAKAASRPLHRGHLAVVPGERDEVAARVQRVTWESRVADPPRTAVLSCLPYQHSRIAA